MASARHLRLEAITTSPGRLHCAYDFDGAAFSTSIWYDGVDFDALTARFGAAQVRRLAFHVAAFQINALCSLRPASLDWGPYADLATAAFETLWRAILHKVWAQWRFENDDPDYSGPELVSRGAVAVLDPIRDRAAGDRVLAFCGGGKDSLVAMKLLGELGADFGTFAYSSSIYGRAAPQHALIGRLVDCFGVQRRHRAWMFDDFLDSPVLELRADLGVRTVTAAETPASIFAALPIALAHGYGGFCLAHERSADAPQTVWAKTGEAINHQWGKSAEAERLVDGYIREQLLADFRYFSILKPIGDAAIFGALRGQEAAVLHAHSCNVAKPWCRRCAKCAYVFLGYAAFLDRGVVDGVFDGENLFDVPQNALLFRQLVGLESRLPFECVGEADEAALFLAMAAAKGWTGRAFAACEARLDGFDEGAILDRSLAVDMVGANIPAALREKFAATLSENASAARKYALGVLTPPP